jgi:hypothetical protein
LVPIYAGISEPTGQHHEVRKGDGMAETHAGQVSRTANPAGDLNLELTNLFAWTEEAEEDPDILSFGSLSICCKD